ncbi:MAG: hypothetical protein E6H08_15260 [Bacteroidetes bacterium]|nr:MAG: hypothetical protein E6H08_15260 [Bacteroidota bacterium]
MKIFILTLTLLVGSYAKVQDTEVFRRIDSIVTKVDSTSSIGALDTLKSGLLNEGGTPSDIFFLRQDRAVQKISVINKSKNYSEKIIFHNGKPVFAQFVQPDGTNWTFYLVGENAYFKDGNMFNKGSSSYWYSMIDAYLDIFKDQVDR